MQPELTLFAGMLGGWEILIIGAFMAAIVGCAVIVAITIWLRRNQSQKPTTSTPPAPPAVAATPVPSGPTVRICKSCHAPLPPGAPEGLCPQCLIKVGLGSEAGIPSGPTPSPSKEG